MGREMPTQNCMPESHHVNVNIYEMGRKSHPCTEPTSLRLLCPTPSERVSVTYTRKVEGRQATARV